MVFYYILLLLKTIPNIYGGTHLSKRVKKIWNIFTSVLVVLFILLAILLVGVRIVGLTPLSVLSGSMEPTYRTGSLIYVKDISATDIKAGDPITFYLNDRVVATHRVIKVDKVNQLFYTKGDANKVADVSPVKFENLIGTPVFTIPQLGYLSNFISTSSGKITALCIMAIAIFLVFLPELLDRMGKNEKKKIETKNDSDIETK